MDICNHFCLLRNYTITDALVFVEDILFPINIYIASYIAFSTIIGLMFISKACCSSLGMKMQYIHYRTFELLLKFLPYSVLVYFENKHSLSDRRYSRKAYSPLFWIFRKSKPFMKNVPRFFSSAVITLSLLTMPLVVYAPGNRRYLVYYLLFDDCVNIKLH